MKLEKRFNFYLLARLCDILRRVVCSDEDVYKGLFNFLPCYLGKTLSTIMTLIIIFVASIKISYLIIFLASVFSLGPGTPCT